MSPERTRELMNQCLTRQGKAEIREDSQSLQEIGFRSLDFSELALRVEDELGRELDFDASLLRNIQTVADVLGFFRQAAG